jgi:hypothetical protein
MKNILSIFTFLFFITASTIAQTPDKIVTFYDNYDIQQFKGVEWHKKFTKISDISKYSKAVLVVELGCATYGCCAWDYTFRGFFGLPQPGTDSVFEKNVISGTDTTKEFRYYQKSTNYEVGRLITPYSSYMRMSSNGFNPKWRHPYVYDVTDFLPIMKDSFGFVALTGGWDDQGKFGFNMNVKLYLYKAENPLMPKRVLNAYNRSFVFKDEDSFRAITPEFRFKLQPNEMAAKYRNIITGHDADGEFKPITYHIMVNNQIVMSKRLWREDCDKTYIQPQSGTWIFSRANWCPGEKIQDEEIDITPFLKPNDSNVVDIYMSDMEGLTAAPKANYIISGHVITYEKMPEYDLQLEDIIAPNSDPNYFLSNSMCQNPKVRLKNLGSKVAKEAYIDYWVDEQKKTTFVWKGSLEPYQSIDVEMKAFPWYGIDTSKPIFYASIQKSQYNRVLNNDTLQRTFKLPAYYNTEKIKIEIKLTSGGTQSQNKLTVYDELNTPIFEKSYTGDAKTYTEEINVPEGCYKMVLTDFLVPYACGDGLRFFVSQNQNITPGTIRILNAVGNGVLRTFNPDFGGMIMHQFTTKKVLGEYFPMSDYDYKEAPKIVNSIGDKNSSSSLNIFPNPSSSKLFFDVENPLSQKISYQITNIEGKLILNGKVNVSKSKTEGIDIQRLNNGNYILVIEGNNSKISKQFQVVK